MGNRRRRLCSCEASAGQRNQQSIGRLEEVMLEAMRFKHDSHLQTLGAVTGRLGHVALLDPGDVRLRGTMLDCQEELGAGLPAVYEGRYAESRLHTPTPTSFWQHCGRRVHSS
jgi:hypothetical protein